MELTEHIEKHVSYPASKQDILMACDNMSDASAEDKQMMMDKLPDMTFQTADEVKAALGM